MLESEIGGTVVSGKTKTIKEEKVKTDVELLEGYNRKKKLHENRKKSIRIEDGEFFKQSSGNNSPAFSPTGRK